MSKAKELLHNLEEYFKNTPRERVLEDWEKTKECDELGPTVEKFLNITVKEHLKYRKHLIEFLENAINVTKKRIINRANFYLPDFHHEDLFDLDLDKEPVTFYDQEDYANHAFDMGQLTVYQEILDKIKLFI